jgi:hypothetical protein
MQKIQDCLFCAKDKGIAISLQKIQGLPNMCIRCRNCQICAKYSGIAKSVLKDTWIAKCVQKGVVRKPLRPKITSPFGNSYKCRLLTDHFSPAVYQPHSIGDHHVWPRFFGGRHFRNRCSFFPARSRANMTQQKTCQLSGHEPTVAK